MRISVITACYNSGITLADTLDSVSAQDFDGLEHIVVDGGSTDKTLDIVKTHGRRVAKVILGPDKGIYDALNKGIAASAGEFIGIMHSDDMYADPSVLRKVADYMSKSGLTAAMGTLSMCGGMSRRKWCAIGRRAILSQKNSAGAGCRLILPSS